MDITVREGSLLDAGRALQLFERTMPACAEVDLGLGSISDGYRNYLNSASLCGFIEASGHLLVADEEDRLVGFVCGAPDSAPGGLGTYYAAWIAVAPECRRMGIAARLLQTLARHAYANGCHKIYGLVQTTNSPALRFLQRLGYRNEAVLARHWRGGDFFMCSRIMSRDDDA